MIDLRSLSPWDQDAVYASVKKTNRVIVAYEDSLSWGYGAEIAARIADDCFAWLDAPVRRVGSTDTFVGLRAAARGRDPAAGGGLQEGVRGDREVLTMATQGFLKRPLSPFFTAEPLSSFLLAFSRESVRPVFFPALFALSAAT